MVRGRQKMDRLLHGCREWQRNYFFIFVRYFFTMSLMASSKRSPNVFSVSTARCFKSLIRSASILVENTFLFAIADILHFSGTNYNKDKLYKIKNYIKNYIKKESMVIKWKSRIDGKLQVYPIYRLLWKYLKHFLINT